MQVPEIDEFITKCLNKGMKSSKVLLRLLKLKFLKESKTLKCLFCKAEFLKTGSEIFPHAP